jgi:hypothetical protein
MALQVWLTEELWQISRSNAGLKMMNAFLHSLGQKQTAI